MKINSIPIAIQEKAVKDSIFTGTKYCFCYNSPNDSTSWDGLIEDGGHGRTFDWKNSLSVLWSEKELLAFRPNDTTHDFKYYLLEGMKEEIERLKPKVKTAKTSHISLGKECNPKQLLKDRIEFLENHGIVFVKIEFIKE